MTMDRRLISAIAAHYHDLQGLRVIPFAGYTLVVAVMVAARVDPIPRAVVLVLGLALTWPTVAWIGRRYDETFGRVAGAECARRAPRAAAFGAVGALAGALVLRDISSLPLDPIWAVVAIGFGVYWYRLGRVFAHQAGLALVAAIWAVVPAAFPGVRSTLDEVVLISLFLIVAGVLDHAALARALRPIPREPSSAVQ